MICRSILKSTQSIGFFACLKIEKTAKNHYFFVKIDFLSPNSAQSPSNFQIVVNQAFPSVRFIPRWENALMTSASSGPCTPTCQIMSLRYSWWIQASRNPPAQAWVLGCVMALEPRTRICRGLSCCVLENPSLVHNFGATVFCLGSTRDATSTTVIWIQPGSFRTSTIAIWTARHNDNNWT